MQSLIFINVKYNIRAVIHQLLASDGNSIQTVFRTFNSHGNAQVHLRDDVKDTLLWINLHVQEVNSDRLENNERNMTDHRWLISKINLILFKIL